MSMSQGEWLDLSNEADLTVSGKEGWNVPLSSRTIRVRCCLGSLCIHFL